MRNKYSEVIVLFVAFVAVQCKGSESCIGVSFALNSPITQHEPVVIHYKIANKLDKPITIDLGFWGKNAFRFSIVKPDKSLLTLPALRQEGIDPGGIVSLQVGSFYSQRLILNEWYELDAPGSYEIRIHLNTPVSILDGQADIESIDTVLNATILPRDEKSLRNRCEDLLRNLRQTKVLRTRTEIAEELSYLKDSIAIPYLEMLVGEREDYNAIMGLVRIGTDEAMEALLTEIKSRDTGSAEMAKSILRQAFPKIQNLRIREKIRVALE